MTATPSDIIAAALRAAKTPRITNTCATIRALYCELLDDGSRIDRYISLDDTGAYTTTTKTAVHVRVYDGAVPSAYDDDDDDAQVGAWYGPLADILAEQGGMLCLRDGTELRKATPEEIAESWIEGGAGMIETEHDGALVQAYVEGA